MRLAVAFALALVLAPAPLGLAAEAERYSGTVVTIDPERGLLVLEEIGPWLAEQGRHLVLRRAIVLTPDTTFASFIRVNVPGAFAGDFLEVELDAENVTPGDFVTVQCVSERGRLIALRVAVAEAH
jgi:hypothetical protein